MRRVRFTLKDRITLIPVEFVATLLPLLLLIVIGAKGPAAAVLAGTVLFPILLPWIPTHDFSTKGFILGGLVALPFALSVLWRHPDWTWWLKTLSALASMLILPPITAFITLNFTGSTTFTSPSGVEKEMRRAIPLQAVAAALAGVLWIYGGFVGK
jgi:hypothetical protein